MCYNIYKFDIIFFFIRHKGVIAEIWYLNNCGNLYSILPYYTIREVGLVKNQEIGDAFNTLICDIADCDDKYCEDEVISWFVVAALRIWTGNKLFSQTYVEALSSFTNKTYTTTQVMTVLNLVSDESLKIKVPEFFQNIVSKDIKSHTCKSRALADSIGRFLV